MSRPSLASRLAQLEAQRPESGWLRRDGLAAILAHVRQHPVEACDPLEGLAPEELRGMARLLYEARQWRATP